MLKGFLHNLFKFKMKIIKNYINGNLVESQSNKYSDIFNPATGEVIGKVNLSNLDDLKKAIDSSNSSIINWQNTTL